MNTKYLNRAEAIRFMGLNGEPQGELLTLIEKCEKQVCEAALPSYTYKVFKTCELSELLVGNDIKMHLEGCGEVILFAATLGHQVDRLIKRFEIENITGAVIADAVATAFIEEYCKELDEILSEKFSEKHLTWRYGLGYGDFPIELQGEFVRLSEADKRIGLHVTDSCMLIPTKSVTAVVGISESPITKEKQSCVGCVMRDTCTFRKEGDHCGCQKASE